MHYVFGEYSLLILLGILFFGGLYLMALCVIEYFKTSDTSCLLYAILCMIPPAVFSFILAKTGYLAYILE